jgi:microcystin-dependent protein
MPNPYIGEVRMFAGNFAPAGWAMCEGQLLTIVDYVALFNLIGTTYGGDGMTTFALPDLRGRIPIHQGDGFTLAQVGGSEQITLTTSQLPAHTHDPLGVGKGGNQRSPVGAVLAVDATGVTMLYSDQSPSSPSGWPVVNNAGGSQPHDNMQPYLCVNFIISLFGIFPSQT